MSRISPPVCMAEVLSPRALTYSGTFHQCACIGLNASRTLPTICVHICNVEAVGSHADQSSSGHQFGSADMCHLRQMPCSADDPPACKCEALEEGAQPREDRLGGRRQGTSQGAAAGVFVTTAAKAFRYDGDIHRPFAAQAEPYAVVRQLTQEYGHLDAGDADGVVHYAFAILFGS